MTPEEGFDLDDFRGTGAEWGTLPKRPRRPPRHQPGEAFLKGPVPMPWLERALVLPGKALHVALLLWQQAGCRRSHTVRFRLANLRKYGMAKQTARRAIRALEAAGLISVRRPAGSALEVTLLEARPDRGA